MKTIYLFILISLLIVSCKCDCPDSYLFGADEIPGWVNNDFDLYDVESMTFLNDKGDTLWLRKDYSTKNEIQRDSIKNVECEADLNLTVDIYYDRTWNRVFFVSDNSDSLGFQYYTQLASLGNFSYKNYDQVNYDEPYDMFAIYRNVMFKIGDLQYSLTTLTQQIGPNGFKKYLDEDYEVLENKFSEVFYFDYPGITIKVYYNDMVGIVGIEELDGVKWIRLI